MIWQIKYTHQAFKDIIKFSAREKERIIDAIKLILKSPLIGKPLQAKYKGKYSLRVWNLRIIYTVEFKNKLIIVLKIKHRRDVYR